MSLKANCLHAIYAAACSFATSRNDRLGAGGIAGRRERFPLMGSKQEV